MKKKLFLFTLALLFCAAGALGYYLRAIPRGDTVESREELLNRAISKGKGWTIAKELELDGALISGANSADHKATLAVFVPTGNGGYQFSSSTNRDAADIIIGGAVIGGKWHDLIWFGGAQTAYAEVTYSINGQAQEPLRYDTADMDIISIENAAKDYSLAVFYVDAEGKRYD